MSHHSPGAGRSPGERKRGFTIDATSSTAATLAAPGLPERILEGTVRCVAAAGVTKTTIDDIARAASCGRATVYRTFPGGRDAVLVAAGRREVERFLARLGDQLDACATLEDALVVGITGCTRQLQIHDALRFVIENEPAVLRPLVSFDGLDPLLARAGTFAEEHLGRFLDGPAARAVGEWATRLVLAYGCPPESVGSPFDLTDAAAARRLVRTFGLPGVTERAPARTTGADNRPLRAPISPTTEE